MVAANRPNTRDRNEICRKATWLLKKLYARSIPKKVMPVLDSLLYAICLEDSDVERADALYQKLVASYPDWNEARVSSITELQAVFADCPDAAWRAMRVKNTLQHVFEENYAFELEGLRRKTGELAARQLQKISGLTPFVRNYVMQNCLDSHVLPLDSKMLRVLQWLGLADAGSQGDQAGDALRPLVRKSEAVMFCHLIRSLANDPRRSGAFEPAARQRNLPGDPIARLEQLVRKGYSAAFRTAAKSGNHKEKKERPKGAPKKRH
jgi:endonuclease-3